MVHGAYAEAQNPAIFLAKLPQFKDIQISPDGLKLLILQKQDGAHHLVTIDVEQLDGFITGNIESQVIFRANKEAFTFRWCEWANNERILCSIMSDSGNAKARRSFGFKLTRLLAINHDGSEALTLVPPPKDRGTGAGLRKNHSQVQDVVLSKLPDKPAEILVQLDRDKVLRPSVYRLNIYTNQLTRVLKHKPGIREWYADWQGNVRLGIGLLRGRPSALIVSQNGSTQRLDITELSDDLPPPVLGMTSDSSGAYLVGYAPDNDRFGLHVVDFATAKIRETLVADPEYDFFGQLHYTLNGQPVAAAWLRHTYQYKWFHPDWKKWFDHLSQALPDVTIRLVNMSRDERRMIFKTAAHNQVPRWYFYDHQTEALTEIGPDYVLPEDMQLAATQPISYSARDGLEIPAYLTLPSKRTSDKNLPTVIFPHGGPSLRDAQSFNHWVQFMAAQGYAVLQPNFRGSTGYGHSFLTAGFREWGKAMQNDVIDGVNWLIQAGIADPDRVCIVGG
ncbi:MAG: prolyl oligopeptidase family serine peptidase, partial [Pseudomonadota bacterium]